MERLKNQRIVLTLDAGGTNFVFSAIQNCQSIVDPISLPSNADDLDRCLQTIVDGFQKVQSCLSEKAVAISFAFPGPADYPTGIIGDLNNFPAFKGGVALGPYLETQFNLPVFINNDGNLFAYGEALHGYLPYLNNLLNEAGSPKEFKNLIGLTLGTGFGGGIVHDKNLIIGDNSNASEIWLLRDIHNPNRNIEESISIRAIQKSYAKESGIEADEFTPKDIFEIAKGQKEGDAKAAIKAFEDFGKALGEAIANLTTIIDGIVVLGGGLAGAHTLFFPSLMDAMNATFKWGENELHRLATSNYNLEDKEQLQKFLSGDTKQIKIPNSDKMVSYDPERRVGIGVSKLGASHAIAIGAYVFALNQLDK